MSSGPIKPGGQPKGGPPISHAILLDKLTGRQTPDSEALASSDDEPDHLRQNNTALGSQQPPKPVRRPSSSWIHDTSQMPTGVPARQGSFATMSPTKTLPPLSSFPNTPPAETGAASWGSRPLAPLAPGVGFFSGVTSGIWNNDSNGSSSRLGEVMPSPTTAAPATSSANGESSTGVASPSASTASRESAIPFAFPLNPTHKALRSSSYSACQREVDSPPNQRGRAFPHSGLQHRPSRPSMLSEVANDGSALGKVSEDEDDEESNESWPVRDQQHMTVEQREIEILKRENASLRQQQQQQQLQFQQQQQQQQQQQLRPRASTGATSLYGLNSAFQEPVPEEGSDYAVDVDENNDVGPDMFGRRTLSRRMSEYGGGHIHSSYSAHERRKIANAKRGIWQTSPAIGNLMGLEHLTQGRRHSFADVPLLQRHNSVASILGDSVSSLDQSQLSEEAQKAFGADSAYSVASDGGSATNNAFASNAAIQSYFTGGGSADGGLGSSNLPSASYSQHYQSSPYASGAESLYSNTRSVSPPRGMFSMQPRPHQRLYIVLFKCARADVFYIQEGTGLRVKPGDLVIVEADRGTDLGTVARDNLDWQTAKELKDHYSEEQYKWLMMYSQTAAADETGAGGGLMAASNGASAVGGMGPPNPHHMQEPANAELKPKLIKRLAQAHEVNNLRDKEGQEAKAKRICMQRVKDHNLNMEILDAEFQMDWKKLTFYYFADSYINFNALVTDLFKIYKTRIWMSAINPASFAVPGSAIGFQPPSGIGPGAIGANIPGQLKERRQSTASSIERGPSAVSPNPSQHSSAGARGLRSSSSHPSVSEAPPVTYPIAYNPTANYTPYAHQYAHAQMAAVPRPGAMAYGQMMPVMDPFQASAYSQGIDGQYQQAGRGRFGGSPVANSHVDQGFQHMGSQQDMFNAFNGLSLDGQR